MNEPVVERHDNATALAVAALIAFAAFRFTGLTRYPPWEDEWITLNQTSGTLMHTFRWLAADQTNPPLAYAMIWAWQKAGGGGLAWMRSLPAFLGTITALPLLVICRRVGLTRDAERLALLLAAASPFLIWFSLDLRSYAAFALFSACSVAAWLVARETATQRALLLATVANSALLLTHYFGVFVVGAELVDAFAFGGPRRRRLLAAGLVAFVPLLPWVAYVAHRATPGAEVLAAATPISRPDLTQVLDPFVRAVGASSVLALDLLVTCLAIAIAAVGLLRAGEWRPQRLLLLMAVVLPVAVTMAVSRWSGQSLWITRYFVSIVAPLSILVAAGAEALAPRRLQRWIPLIAFWPISASISTARAGQEKVPYDRLAAAIAPPGARADVFALSEADGGPLAWLAAHGAGAMRVTVIGSMADITATTGWLVHSEQAAWSDSRQWRGLPPEVMLRRRGYRLGTPVSVVGQFDDLRQTADSVVAVPFHSVPPP